MIKRLFLIFFIIIISATPVIAKGQKRFLISGNPDYPPLSWRLNKTIVGAGIEILQKAALPSRLKVEAVYVGPWARVQHEAKTGRIDAIAGLYKTAERAEYLVFLEPPFMMDPVAVFVAKGRKFPFRKLEDLKGKKGCTVFGNSQGPEFDAFAQRHLNLRYPRTVKEGFDLLLSGRADYMVHGLYPGLAVAEMEKMKARIEYLPQYLSSEGLYIGIAKNSPYITYATELQQALKKLRDKGIVKKTMDRYLIKWGETGPKGGVLLDP